MSDSQMDVALYLKNQDDPQLKSIGDFVEGRTKRILSLNKELQSLKDQLEKEKERKEFWKRASSNSEEAFIKSDKQLKKAEKVIKLIEYGPLRYYDSVYKDTEWDTCCSGKDCGYLGMPIDPEYFIYQDLKRARSYFQEKNKEIESEKK